MRAYTEGVGANTPWFAPCLGKKCILVESRRCRLKSRGYNVVVCSFEFTAGSFLRSVKSRQALFWRRPSLFFFFFVPNCLAPNMCVFPSFFFLSHPLFCEKESGKRKRIGKNQVSENFLEKKRRRGRLKRRAEVAAREQKKRSRAGTPEPRSEGKECLAHISTPNIQRGARYIAVRAPPLSCCKNVHAYGYGLVCHE